jgi:hypothetical protein
VSHVCKANKLRKLPTKIAISKVLIPTIQEMCATFLYFLCFVIITQQIMTTPRRYPISRISKMLAITTSAETRK